LSKELKTSLSVKLRLLVQLGMPASKLSRKRKTSQEGITIQS
jgi:hypothetical protein